MTKIKKLLSVLIAVLVLMSALPMAAVSAASYQKITTSEPYAMTLSYDEIETVRFIPEKTGWYKFYTTGDYDTYATLTNPIFNVELYSDDINENLNFCIKRMLTAGHTYYLEVGTYISYNETAEFELFVEEAVYATSVTISKEPDNPNVVEGYEYDTMFCDGLEATYTLSDGTQQVWSYDEDNYICDSLVELDTGVDILGRYYVKLSCDNVYKQYYFTTVENTVDRIEYSGSAIEFYENTNGYYDEDMGGYYYFYDLPEDTSVTVYYTDGSYEFGSINDKFKYGYVTDYDNQYDTTWTTDGDNYVTLSYLGAEAQLPVNILPCPFKSVTLNSAPTYKYVYGDSMWGFMYEDEWWGEITYILYPQVLTGLSFTVEYQDGTTQTYTDEDFDTYNHLLDGYEYSIDVVYAETIGTYPVTLYYKGYELTYDIELIESPVASIEFISDPDVTEYIGIFYPVFNGMELKITYTDGTSETVTLSEENTVYTFDLTYEITVGDNTVYAYYEYSEELGEHYIFSCLGTESAYTGCTFDYDYYVDTIEVEKFTGDVDGTVLNVKFTDGTNSKITLDVLDFVTYEDGSIAGAAMTDEGIALFLLEEVSDGNYTLDILGEHIEISVIEPANSGILGDANKDGSVNIKDVTAIQKHIASLEIIPEDALVLADTDIDGDVNIKDATAIQKHIAGIITGYPIGEAL